MHPWGVENLALSEGGGGCPFGRAIYIYAAYMVRSMKLRPYMGDGKLVRVATVILQGFGSVFAVVFKNRKKI